jgi:hypothetical protein
VYPDALEPWAPGLNFSECLLSGTPTTAGIFDTNVNCLLDCGGVGRRTADTELQQQHQRLIACSINIEKGLQNITLEQGKSAAMPHGKTTSNLFYLRTAVLSGNWTQLFIECGCFFWTNRHC